MGKFKRQAISYWNCGYSNVSKDPEVKRKKEKTSLEKWGTTNPSKAAQIKNVIREKTLENSASAMEKRKETYIQKYGVEHYSQTVEYKEKYRNTSIKKYGVEHPSQSEHVKQKTKETNVEKYGVEHPSQCESVKKQIAETNLDRYGNICSAQTHDVKKTLHDRYGGNSSFSNPNVQQKAIITRQYKKYGKLLEDFRDEWRDSYFKHGLTQTLVNYPTIGVKTAMDTFLAPNERICSKGRSHTESLVKQELEKTGLIFEINQRSVIPDNNRLEVDLIDRKNKITVEFNGVYWHQWVSDRVDLDIHKAEKLRELGYHHVSIDETDIQKLPKIKNILNPYKTRIQARKCKVAAITDNKVIRNFLDTNHLQGYIHCDSAYGLYQGPMLVQIMTFGKDRFNKKYDVELLRFATVSDSYVVGGAQKLFTGAVRHEKFKSCVSYSNRKYFSGKSYKMLGFESHGYTSKGYVWFKNHNILSRYQTQKHKLPTLLENFNCDFTEEQNMQSHGWRKVYDFGHEKFVWSSFTKQRVKPSDL